MDYYLDTEFLEGSQKKLFGKTKPTIDLISIGIVSEDDREYYAISKDFNLKEAWNRYDLDHGSGDQRNRPPRKIYWIRENILKPIFKELWYEKCHLQNLHHVTNDFTYKNLKKLISLYGKTNKEIAEEVKHFVYYTGWEVDPPVHKQKLDEKGDINFYTYYGDYDWVVFCWLFGKMIDLPKRFPMYSKDLKQELDELGGFRKMYHESLDSWLKLVKINKDYPKQDKEHNALSDARFNRLLHKFIEQY